MIFKREERREIQIDGRGKLRMQKFFFSFSFFFSFCNFPSIENTLGKDEDFGG